MSILEIGCCGAYCKTCKSFRGGHCRGCRLGYDNGQRNIERARCKIKVCCLKEKQMQTCADCEGFISCILLQVWYKKSGVKYRRYRQSAEFIRAFGYKSFLAIAEDWKDASGKLPTNHSSGA